MNPEDIQTLRTASRKIDEIRGIASELFIPGSYSSTWDTTTGTSSTIFKTRPSPTVVKAATTDVRHFILNGSPVLFGSIIKILLENSDSETQEKIRKLAKQWSIESGVKDGVTGFGIELVLNDEHISRHKVIDLHLNADIMHLDPTKTREADLMAVDSFKAISDMIFVSTIQNLAHILLVLDDRYIAPILAEYASKAGKR